MNRLDKLFSEKQRDILSIFFTAGFPDVDDTTRIARALNEAGVDLVEVGMPFSDPVADGPTIQSSSAQALANGMSMERLMVELPAICNAGPPIILMGYLNPVLKYGIAKFCQNASDAGVAGLILPDLPLEEFERRYRQIFREYNLHNILLITPQTSAERIKRIDQASTSFIYMVSDAGTTGATGEISEAQLAYYRRIRDLELRSPRLIGFGVHDSKSFKTACSYSNGAIVGSAFVKAITDKRNDINNTVKLFVESLKGKRE